MPGHSLVHLPLPSIGSTVGREQELEVEKLVYDIDGWEPKTEGTLSSNPCCPRIFTYIDNNEIESLLDSGSNTTCISEDLLAQLNPSIIKTLPVTNLFMQGAFKGKRTIRVKQQISVRIQIGNFDCNTVFLVILRLCREIIIGSNWLLRNGAVIDYEKREFRVKNTILREPALTFRG